MNTGIITIIKTASLTLPAFEICLLMCIVTICLVLKHTRIGLIATYIFVYRWGWIIMAGHGQTATVAYLIFGMFVGILTTIGMLHNSHNND